MNKALELFEKREGKWQPLSLGSVSRLPVRHEIWASMEGKEITGKLTRDGKIAGYIAGTEDLREFYKTKSAVNVWSWSEAADMMLKSKSELLSDKLHEALAESLKVFGENCRLLKVEYGKGEVKNGTVSEVQG